VDKEAGTKIAAKTGRFVPSVTPDYRLSPRMGAEPFALAQYACEYGAWADRHVLITGFLMI
jgi:hypothetical protein